ncbi:hypothetical protein Salat_2121600 [Sesamum alatum]|uniref:Uncharacterized protein n=1 Tax=Sesamum alatum TaxID=300844 RepID=A0AAE1Y100_9LAMI|nr:hypothetical protein Salat_2121600 [Sesamum alatum]
MNLRNATASHELIEEQIEQCPLSLGALSGTAQDRSFSALHGLRKIHATGSILVDITRFFSSEDPVMCRRAKAIIPGLLRRINRLEGDVEDLKSKNQKIRKKLVAMVLILVVWFWWGWTRFP